MATCTPIAQSPVHCEQMPCAACLQERGSGSSVRQSRTVDGRGPPLPMGMGMNLDAVQEIADALAGGMLNGLHGNMCTYSLLALGTTSRPSIHAPLYAPLLNESLKPCLGLRGRCLLDTKDAGLKKCVCPGVCAADD